MVMSKDDSGGAICNHIREDIAGMNQTPVEKPDRDDSLLDNLVGAIALNTDEMLL